MEEIKQYEIWNADFEEGGVYSGYNKRPCVIVSNNSCNTFSPVITIVPLTTAPKKPLPTHCVVSSSYVVSTALCENIVGVKRNKLIEKIGELNDFEKLNIVYCLKKQLGIE